MPQQQLLLLSAAASRGQATVKSLVLEVEIQGVQLTFLVDSGSSSCFLDQRFVDRFTGRTTTPSIVHVQVAGGRVLECKEQFIGLTWTAQGYTFCDDFRVLELQSYDGIVGLDWLAKHSPMVTHWAQGWIAFPIGNDWGVLHGKGHLGITHALVDLHLIQNEGGKSTVEYSPEISALLAEFASVFAEPEGLPPTRQYDHHIPLIPGARPVSMRPYRVAPELKTEIERQVKELLRQGVITHSSSPFASHVLLVKKIDKAMGQDPSIPPLWRLVIDYRHLNALTVKGKYPLPVIDELLDELSGATWFSKLDLRAGYHQIRLAPGEEPKTAFQTHSGHYEFKVMAFGLSGAPATFQHAMNASLEPVLRKFALVFFDDILIYSPDFESHVQHVRTVLEILKRDQWQAKMSKCEFAQRRIAYLGHVISADGVSTDQSKIEAIRTWSVPTTLKELRGFLSLSGYYRKFIKRYAIISQPLTALLKKGTLFVWTEAAEIAFQTLKTALMTAPVLALPDYTVQFVVETDACDSGIGAVLSQKGHPLAFVSRALGPRNKGLSVYEKEYLAILLAVQQWRSYLQLGEFVIRTDHKSLVHLTDQRLHTDWQQKVLTKMMGLQFRVVYKKGILNGAADALSRRPHVDSELYNVSQVQPVWLDQVVASYANDTSALEKIQKLAVDPASVPRYTLSTGVLRYDNRILVGRDSATQRQIIAAFHDSPIGGHSGFPVTYRRLASLFKWTGMKMAVKEFVQSCRVCQQAKPERNLPPGLLQPLPIPSGPWDMATMDFIDGLPQSKQFNCILVVVDKLSKYAHFIPLAHAYTASKVAELFVDTIYRLHGMPKILVSDRDPVFTSKFWRCVFQATGTQLRMSTAYHPETDGQTERVNQSIECFMRCFISSHPKKWSQWLGLCEFWYNTNWHSSLGKSPFEVIYGRQPRYFGITASSSIGPDDIQQWLIDRQLIISSVH